MTLDLPSLESWLWGSADILRGKVESKDIQPLTISIIDRIKKK